MDAVSLFHPAIQFGEAWGQDEQLDSLFLTGFFKPSSEFTPPSTWMARMGKGAYRMRYSRNWAAQREEALGKVRTTS